MMMIHNATFRCLFLLIALAGSLLYAAPRIACDSPVCDFGTVTNGMKITHEFMIWNRGNSPLTITKVRACCGMKASMDDMEIAPNSNSVCRAVFDLARRNGAQDKKIYLASDDPQAPYFSLALKGTCPSRPPQAVQKVSPDADQAKIRAIPEKIIVLSSQEEALQRQVMLTGNNGAVFEVLSVELVNAEGTVKVTQIRPDRWRCSLSILPAGIKPGASLRVVASYEDGPQLEITLEVKEIDGVRR
jgi:hypothetical protein